MRRRVEGMAALMCAGLLAACAGGADPAPSRSLAVDGADWVRTFAPDHAPGRHKATYKPYTAVLDFAGREPITKGPGGFDTHHRGWYVGWNEVTVGGATHDFWHMKDGVYQQLVEWADEAPHAHAFVVEWRLPDGTVVLRERRRVALQPALSGDGHRVVDLSTTLEAVGAPVRLEGDLHHAGVHVRMANEVFWHMWSTEYVFPEGAEEREGNEVAGAWWLVCSPVVRDQRYALLYMTHPQPFDAPPVLSARRYGRFGAFYEPALEPGAPQTWRFRLVLAEGTIDTAEAQEHFDAFRSEPLVPAGGGA